MPKTRRGPGRHPRADTNRLDSARISPDRPDGSALTARAATLGEWNELVRRVRLGRSLKHFGLTFSSYADSDGTGIHCGIATLAVDCEVGYSTARRYLAWFRRVGLVDLTRRGNRSGLSDEYRLIIGPDVWQHLKAEGIEVPDPDQYKAMKHELRDTNRDAQKDRRRRQHQRSTAASAEIEAPGDDQRSLMVSADGSPPEEGQRSLQSGALIVPISAHFGPDQRSPMSEPPPSLYTFPEEHTFPVDGGDHRTEVAVVGERPEHDFVADPRTGMCQECENPRANRVHRRRSR